MDRVLVTGCSGFVGRVLTARLAERGFEVWGIDRAGEGGGVAGEHYMPLDLTDGNALGGFLERAKPRHIVHLAAQSSAGRSFDAPEETIRNNTLPVLHILEFLRTQKTGTRLLAVGSAEIYGPVTPDDLPLAETRATNPVSPYALSKLIQEQCCGLYHALYEADVVSTRSFNHTGAGQSDAFVLSSFARQVAEIRAGEREPVVEVGNVDVRRDFSDVRDVCEAYVALLDRGRGGAVYNVCSGASHSLRELLEKLASLAGVDIEIRVEPGRVRPVDIEELRGDHQKITADTGWRPRTPVENTLSSLLEYWSHTGGPAAQ
ncbi:MAG: GDP-mannose 4,6-dehydratase [Candidatus Krumholzibacteriia bacterium]